MPEEQVHKMIEVTALASNKQKYSQQMNMWPLDEF